MKKSRFTDEQIIGFLKQAESGMPVKMISFEWGGNTAVIAHRARQPGGSPSH